LLSRWQQRRDDLMMKSTLIAVLLAGAALSAAGTFTVAQGDVKVTCPMTIGGSFDTKTKALSGSLTASAAQPSALDGNIAVDLRTLDTGISLRNEHLKEHYLEIDKGAGYDNAVLSNIELKGLNPGAPGKGSFAGSLMLHGVKRTVGGLVEVRKAGAGVRVKASFPVNLPDYNISEPRYLGVGVKNTVQIEVTFTVTP
jgi:polyisoprenoid-binding protein YceI